MRKAIDTKTYEIDGEQIPLVNSVRLVERRFYNRAIKTEIKNKKPQLGNIKRTTTFNYSQRFTRKWFRL